MSFILLSATITALLLALGWTPIVRGASLTVGFLDKPGGRKIHQSPTAYGGGMVLFIAFFGALRLFIPWLYPFVSVDKAQIVGLFLGALFITILGLVDDLLALPPMVKLLGQILAGLIIFLYGLRIEVLTNPLGGVIELRGLSFFVTILWIISLVNAINLIDGLDGLATGVCSIVAFSLAFIGMFQNEYLVVCYFLILGGACVGFLRSNYFPASIFLGDSGSMLLGFLLAAISLMGARKSSLAIALLFPLVIGLLVPVVDTFTAILRRWGSGRPIFTADKRHLHHRLLALGLKQRQIVNAFYVLTLYLCLHAFAFVLIDIRYSVVIIALLGLGLFLAFRFLFFIEEKIGHFNEQLIESGIAKPEDKNATTSVHPYRINALERFIEGQTKKVTYWIIHHPRPFLLSTSVLILIIIVSNAFTLPYSLAIKWATSRTQYTVSRGQLHDEFEPGLRIPLKVTERKCSKYRAYNANGTELFLAPTRFPKSALWVPLPEEMSNKPWTLSIFYHRFFSFFASPYEREYYPSAELSTQGKNILFWKRESIQRDSMVLPAEGNYMTKVTVQVARGGKDHFTNDAILYVTFPDLQIYENTILEYFVRAAPTYERRRFLPDLRYSVQGWLDEGRTDDRMEPDQHGISARWNSDLTEFATNRWYKRQISLKPFAGHKLKGLYLMFNDYPPLAPDHPVFSKKNQGYIIVYFDGIKVYRQPAPSIISNLN